MNMRSQATKCEGQENNELLTTQYNEKYIQWMWSTIDLQLEQINLNLWTKTPMDPGFLWDEKSKWKSIYIYIYIQVWWQNIPKVIK